MAYVTPTNNPDVLRHWDIFKNALENTLKMNGLWHDFNLKFYYNEYKVDKINPFELCLRASTHSHNTSMSVELLSANNSLYFKAGFIRSRKGQYRKRGQAFKDNKVNIDLITDICEYVASSLLTDYEMYTHIENKENKENIIFEKKMSEMFHHSNNTLSGRLGSNRADLLIDGRDFQVYGINYDGDIKFSVNIDGITPTEMAEIAKILAR